MGEITQAGALKQRTELKALAEKVAAFNSGTLAQDLAKDCLVLLADLEEAERTISRQQTAIDGQVAEINTLKDDRNSLLAKKFAKFNGEECWIWQGDGEDHLESLVCPVVISPADLTAMQAELAATRKQLAEAQAQLQNANGCFSAAWDEGLLDRISEAGHSYGDGSLADLVQRRLLYAIFAAPHEALQSAIAEAVAPYKRDAERLDFIEQYAPIFYPGYYSGGWQKDKKLGTLCWDGNTSEGSTLRAAIDAALAAKEDKHG